MPQSSDNWCYFSTCSINILIQSTITYFMQFSRKTTQHFLILISTYTSIVIERNSPSLELTVSSCWYYMFVCLLFVFRYGCSGGGRTTQVLLRGYWSLILPGEFCKFRFWGNTSRKVTRNPQWVTAIIIITIETPYICIHSIYKCIYRVHT